MTPPSAPNPLDLSTSPLALGCWGFADPDLWGNTGRSDAVAVIHAALDHGINLLDTAPGYGNGLSEEILGEALDGRRGQVLIATKVPDSAFSADGVRASLEASLRRLKTDWIDLLQIHWVGDEARFEEVIAAFESARDAGLVRACGVCNFGPRHLERLKACATGWVSNQLPYNLLWRAIEFEIQQRCVDEGLGILAYSPLQQGLLSGRYTTADDVPPGRARSRHFAGSRPLARHGEPGCEAETFRAIGEIRRIADEAGHPMPHLA
ncbi:MAG: aldo/keto reductase, partial [Verrucomicrobia bacterium]